jgi:hypothetical protein
MGSTWGGPNAGYVPSDRVTACLACVMGEDNYRELAKQVNSGQMSQGEVAARGGALLAVTFGAFYAPGLLGSLTLRAPQLAAAGAAIGAGAPVASQVATSPLGVRAAQMFPRIMSDLFGKYSGASGSVAQAQTVLAEIQFFGGRLIPPPGLTMQLVLQYREIALQTIARGQDTLGVQQMRLQILDAVLNTLAR